MKNEDDEDEEFIWEEVDKLLKSDRERVQDNVMSILEDLCKGTRFVAAELWTLPHGVSAPSSLSAQMVSCISIYSVDVMMHLDVFRCLSLENVHSIGFRAEGY